MAAFVVGLVLVLAMAAHSGKASNLAFRVGRSYLDHVSSLGTEKGS